LLYLLSQDRSGRYLCGTLVWSGKIEEYGPAEAPAGCFSLKMLDFTGASDEATFTVIKWPVLPQE
ncbi:hypothetical protein YH84_24465, partial [Salmonella enterica]|nr:hypothetical protein [Salmonella enterica]